MASDTGHAGAALTRPLSPRTKTTTASERSSGAPPATFGLWVRDGHDR